MKNPFKKEKKNSVLTVQFDSEEPDVKITFDASKKMSILEVLLENKIDISHSCGGMGSCGTCLVKISGGEDLLSKRNLIERSMSDERGFSENERLSCQNLARSQITIKITSEATGESGY